MNKGTYTPEQWTNEILPFYADNGLKPTVSKFGVTRQAIAVHIKKGKSPKPVAKAVTHKAVTGFKPGAVTYAGRSMDELIAENQKLRNCLDILLAP